MSDVSVTATIARHLDELGDRYQPLESFCAGVEAELDGWPPPASFSDETWQERYARNKEWSEAEPREAYGR